MDSILRLNEFFIEGGKQDLSHVLLHITEPSTPEEAKKGYFFALCEVNEAEPSFIKKLQEMIDRAENEYYEIQDDAEKDSFETVLEKLNGEAFTLEKARGDLHCIVGAIRPREIIFSYFGNPELLLYYRNKHGAYEKMDLIRGNGDDGAPNDSELFSQIIQGKLSPGDYLFAGTPHIVDFFSHDRLEKIITSRSALQSAQHLEKVLGELRNGFSFGGLIINLYQPDVEELSGKKIRTATQGASNASLQKLFRAEDVTTSTLSPSLIPKLDQLRGLLNIKTAENKTEIEPEPADDQPPEIMSAHLLSRPAKNKQSQRNLGDRLAPIFGKIWQILKVIGQLLLQFLILVYVFFYNLLRGIVLLFIIIINYKNRRATIIENWRLSWRGYKENIRHLPLLTKLMLLGSFLFAAIFIVSIIYIRYNQGVVAAENAFNSALEQLKNKRGSAEDALIYKNDELAFSEYKAARDILAQLICNTKEQKIACADIAAQLNDLGVKLRKVLPLNTATLTDFSLPSNAPAGLIKIKNKLIAYSPATSTLFVYDTMNGETKMIPTYSSIGGFTEASVPKENDYALFLYNNKQLMQLNPADLSTKLVDISFPSGKANLSSFIIYNRRLYTLDTLNSTIFRHDPIKTGFGQGVEWLKDKSISLSDGFDLAIDGDLFVSKNNGQIAKYTSGLSQPFPLTGLDPELSSGTRLWTYTDIPYLYILDSQNKRLIIFEKNGHLVGQLTNDTLNNPTGMVIDSVAKIIYLLDSGKLLKAPLPQ